MFDRNRWRQRFKKYLFTVFIGMGIAFILIWITLPKTHETVLPPQKRSEEKSPSEKKHVLSEAEGNEEKSPQFIHIIRVAQESRRAGEPESQSTNHQLPVTTRHTTLDTRHSTLNQQSETSETLVLRNQQSVRQSPIALEEASKEDVEAEKHVLSKAEGIEFHERDPILISQGKKLLKKGEFPMLFNQYENHFTTTYAYLMAMKKHAHARLTLSNFNPYAIGIGVKDQRSYGLMQLNAVNFQRLGLNTKTVFEPDKNIEAGCKILAENLKRFNGDLRKALIAYVAGSGNVSKIIRAFDQGKCVREAPEGYEEILIYLDNVATAYKRYRRQQTFSRREIQ